MKKIILLGLLLPLSLFAERHDMSDKKYSKDRYSACGIESYSYKHSQGIYSKKKKYAKLTLEQRHMMCKNGTDVLVQEK